MAHCERLGGGSLSCLWLATREVNLSSSRCILSSDDLGPLVLRHRLWLGCTEDESVSTLAEVGLAGPLQRPHLAGLPGLPQPVGALQAQSRITQLLGAAGHTTLVTPAGVTGLLPQVSKLP